MAKTKRALPHKSGKKAVAKVAAEADRLEIMKTYKLFIGGQFPRTESGRYYAAKNNKGTVLANVCLASRKDFRNAVQAARTAWPAWKARTAYNRAQILYRMAEMLEGRKIQLEEEMIRQDYSRSLARKEITLSIDRLIYYAGWADKYQQILSTVNPVASPHFNFSVPEPMGVISAIAPPEPALIGLVSLIAPAIAGGNTFVALASYPFPLTAITLSEALHSADLPAGVVNILTGKEAELAPVMAEHMDVNAVIYAGKDREIARELAAKGAVNVKRICQYDQVNWLTDDGQSPWFIEDFQEIKTTWHPIECLAGGGSAY